MGARPVAGMSIKFIGEFSDAADIHLKPGELGLFVSSLWIHSIYQWWLRCPCGSGGILDGHTVNSTDPVDITPSIICPSGCHYFIRSGVII